jgi:putative flavoprotein involved in K+ transport
MPEPTEVIVIGAGPGGLAAGRALSRAGLPTRILERGEEVGARWRGHYDSLRLNSGRLISSLPGLRMPRRYGRWVRRDDFIEYLGQYAQQIDAPIEFGVAVQRIDRAAEGWTVRTTAGVRQAAAVVVATGINGVAYRPEWAREGSLGGRVVHATEYRNATPYRGRDVLVVGTGASAHDIALDLARNGAARVRISVRTPPVLVPRRMFGASSATITHFTKHYTKTPPAVLNRTSLWMHRLYYGGDASRYLGTPPVGMMTALAERGHGIALEVGLLAALKEGRVHAVAAVEHFDGEDVVLADGQRLRPDAVVLATGQRTGLQPLVGHLGVLGADERPLAHGGGTLAQAPRLHFLGYRLPGGQLPDMRVDAPAIAKQLRRLAIDRPRDDRVRRSPIAEPAVEYPTGHA